MNFAFIDHLAERLGTPRWVIWVGIAGVLLALVIAYRRARGGASGATNPNSAGDVLNGPWSHGADMSSANPFSSSPDGGADTGVTPSGTMPPVAIPPTPSSGPRQVTTIILPADMTWPQIAQTYTGSSQNANWLLSWNAQLHSQPWWTVAKGTKINVPR